MFKTPRIDGHPNAHACARRFAMSRTRLFWLVAVLLLLPAGSAIAQTMPAAALVVKTADYELYYMPEYPQDGERAVLLLDRAVAVAKAKYGTTYRGTPCKVHLYPTPTGMASTGGAGITSSISGAPGPNASIASCTVHMLTASAPDWKTASGSSWGDTKDGTYWDAMLVNEYITIFQDLTAAIKPIGFRYYSAPSWFVQGLEAFDGYYHATEASRDRLRGLLRDGRLGVRNRRTYVVCCKRSDAVGVNASLQTMAVKDDYVDGLALTTFLALQFGEEVHARILRSPRLTFEEALVQETGASLDELFEAYAVWVNQ